jgi:hypothetical protein
MGNATRLVGPDNPGHGLSCQLAVSWQLALSCQLTLSHVSHITEAGAAIVARLHHPGPRRPLLPGLRRPLLPGIHRPVLPGTRRPVLPGRRRPTSSSQNLPSSTSIFYLHLPQVCISIPHFYPPFPLTILTISLAGPLPSAVPLPAVPLPAVPLPFALCRCYSPCARKRYITTACACNKLEVLDCIDY